MACHRMGATAIGLCRLKPRSDYAGTLHVATTCRLLTTDAVLSATTDYIMKNTYCLWIAIPEVTFTQNCLFCPLCLPTKLISVAECRDWTHNSLVGTQAHTWSTELQGRMEENEDPLNLCFAKNSKMSVSAERLTTIKPIAWRLQIHFLSFLLLNLIYAQHIHTFNAPTRLFVQFSLRKVI